MTPRTQRQADAAKANGRRSFGPTSCDGKAKSALNAVAHGLVAKRPMVLAGESETEYEGFIDAWFGALRPASVPVATIVAQLADLAWRLERLDHIEHGHLLARLEEELMATSSARQAKALERAAAGLTALLDAVQRSAAPIGREQADSFIAGCTAVGALVAEVEGLPLALIERFNGALKVIDSAQARPEFATAFLLIAEVGRELSVQLATQTRVAQVAVGEQRQRIATEVLLVRDPDARRFSRYRQMIEKAMSNQFELLKQAQAATTYAAEHLTEQELRVKLRVVK